MTEQEFVPVPGEMLCVLFLFVNLEGESLLIDLLSELYCFSKFVFAFFLLLLTMDWKLQSSAVSSLKDKADPFYHSPKCLMRVIQRSNSFFIICSLYCEQWSNHHLCGVTLEMYLVA